jgi:CubicO group peptidase (beta-lactamase class C family)
MFKSILALSLILFGLVSARAEMPTSLTAAVPEIRAGFAAWKEEAHVPGLVWAVVDANGLVHVEMLGVQDLETRRPVTADTAFRIASMSKAFTAYAALDLAAAGKLRLSDPVSRYVPETARWAKGVTVADLMHHTAGFVTDDPWGDRQQPLSEAAFTAMLRQGAPFTAPPRTRYEYSNFGYALLGRVVARAARKDYAAHMQARIFAPLGMTASTFEVGDVPKERLARGYRWENDAYVLEPDMAHGAFSPMGGLVTTANDYAKWIAFLLKDQPRLAEMGRGEGFAQMRRRPGKEGAACRFVAVYAAGLQSGPDCTLGPVLFHGGGFPGYGSHMLLIPEAGVGVFALTNRTYSGPSPPVWDAADALKRSGFLRARTIDVSPALAEAHAAAARIFAAGGVEAEAPFLAMNFLMDRSAANWRNMLSAVKAQSGACTPAPAPIATGALSGRFRWTCEKGAVEGELLLAPTFTTQLQSLSFCFVAPAG